MGTMDVEPAFVDTNILVYANTATAPLQIRAQEALRRPVEAGAELWIRRQILREYLATLTRPQPFSTPAPPDILISDVARFSTQFRPAEDGASVTANLVRLMASIPIGGKQVHDANIVATMLAHGIPRLLTHNASDFARFIPSIGIIPLISTDPE